MHSTIAPLGRIVSEELSTKFEADISLSFESLFSADLAGRARAFKALSAAECPLKRRQRWPDYCNRKTRLTRLGMTRQGKARYGAWDATASTATSAGAIVLERP